MGKVRSTKCSKIARVDPTGLDKAVEVEEESASADLGPVPMFVQTIMEQLQSHLAEERDSGLNSLSVASSKPAYLEEVLKMSSEVFKTVGPLMLDSSLSVRHSAAGCLRNFSSVNMDICEEMIRADVLTPLVVLIKQKYCGGDWTPQSKEKKSKQPFKIDSATEAYVEAISLLANLCESGETAVKVFNREGLGDGLCKFLTVADYGVRVSLCTALCLYSATEDNAEAISNQPQLEEILMKILLLSTDTIDIDSYQLAHFQTTAIGILINQHQGDLRKLPPATVPIVMKIINTSLEFDHGTELNKLSSEIPLHNNRTQEVYHREVESDMKSIFEMDEKCEGVKALVNSQIMSLQILSNILSSDDDGPWVDDDGGSGDGDSVEDFEEMANGDEEDVEMKDISSEIPLEVYESLSSLGTIGIVLGKIKSLPVNVGQLLKEDETRGVPLYRKSDILRSTALLCLQNLVEVLTIADLEKVIGIVDLWTGLGSALADCDPSDETMIEAVTSAMRAIIQSIVNQKAIHPAADKLCSGLSVFPRVIEAVSISKVKVNVIKIIGCIGTLLTRFPKETLVDGVKIEIIIGQIAEHFLQFLSTIKMEREGLWVAAEIFDTLFDVLAEDDYNHVIKTTGLIEKLKIVQPVFKRQVRSERRSLGENGAVIQTANTNLPRFIQYKEKHGAC